MHRVGGFSINENNLQETFQNCKIDFSTNLTGSCWAGPSYLKNVLVCAGEASI